MGAFGLCMNQHINAIFSVNNISWQFRPYYAVHNQKQPKNIKMEFLYHLPLLIQLSSEAKGIVVALLLILYCLLRWIKNTTTKGKQPPQPSNSWPIIGHLHLLKGLPHVALGKLADQYGSIFIIKLGVHRALVVSTSEMAKECMGGTNDKVFLYPLHTIFREHMTYNSAMLAFSPYGQYWRELRKIATVELLSNHRVEMYKNVRISEIRSAIKEISAVASESIDMKQWFSDISTNTIVRLVAGKSLKEFYQGEKYNQCAKAINNFFELAGVFIPADALPFLKWFDIGGYEKKMKMVAKQIDHVVQRWLEEHKTRSGTKEAQEKRDFMDVLLGIYESAQETSSKFETDTIIKATCMQMILAAADTTAVTLTWALSLLLNNKEILMKTQAEIDAVVGKERLVDESDLKNLVYMQSVLKESMRLYPAAPLSVPRESIADCIANGYHMPAGTQLFVNIYKIHRDPKVWEDPLYFNPERFLTACKDYDFQGKSNEFMPFGHGRRICPGISFAQQAMQFTLASLLHGFEISIPSSETVDMTEGSGLTNHKVTPLEVMLTQRLPQHLYNNTTMLVN